jgi:predicted RNA-binding protein YlxR (DUF448 family)
MKNKNINNKKKNSVRKCIVSGEVMEKEQLIRFVNSPDNIIIPDFKNRLGGKGVWVEAKKSILAKAIEKNSFAKALKTKIKVDKTLLEMVEKAYLKKGLDYISFAKKAGVLITGFEKVKEIIIKDKILFLIEAKDSDGDGKSKMLKIASKLPIFELYKTEELDKALNKINTVHIAIRKSEMGNSVYKELNKIELFINS